MRKISYWFVAFMVLMVAVSCADYDEGLDILSLDVQLEFPSSYDGAHNGLRVELQNGVASTFGCCWCSPLSCTIWTVQDQLFSP